MGNQNTQPLSVFVMAEGEAATHALKRALQTWQGVYFAPALPVSCLLPWVNLYGDLSDNRAYESLIDDILDFLTATSLPDPTSIPQADSIFEAIKNRPRSVHTVVWAIHQQAAAARGARVVINMPPGGVFYAQALAQLFKEIRFIHVVQDPRARAGAMKSRSRDLGALIEATTWVQAQETASTLQTRNPQRVLSLRLEDLQADEEAVLQSIAGFLSISHAPVRNLVDVVARRAGVHGFKRVLSLEDLETIEGLAGGLMDRYGYARLTQGSAPLRAGLLATADECSLVSRYDPESVQAPSTATAAALRAYIRQLARRLLGRSFVGIPASTRAKARASGM